MRRLILLLLLSGVLVAQGSDRGKSLFEQALNSFTGSGPSRSPLTAVDQLQQSADLGYVPAQTALGTLYDRGHIVSREPQHADDLYVKAARQGDRLAGWLVGRLTIRGDISPSSGDHDQLLRASSESGDAFGEYLLGLRLKDRDPSAAFEVFHQAAEQGLPYAAYETGIALRNGRGTNLNKLEAYQWLLVSMQEGVSEAVIPVSELESEFGSKQTEAAKDLARELRDRTLRAKHANGCTGWDGELDRIPTPPPLETQHYCR
jgi:TPR repeat protein